MPRQAVRPRELISCRLLVCCCAAPNITGVAYSALNYAGGGQITVTGFGFGLLPSVVSNGLAMTIVSSSQVGASLRCGRSLAWRWDVSFADHDCISKPARLHLVLFSG